MANALGFGGMGNKNQGFSGSTGGGQVQPLQLKMGQDGKLGLSTDGSGGLVNSALNYLKGAAAPAASNAFSNQAIGASTAMGGPAAAQAAGATGGAAAGGW